MCTFSTIDTLMKLTGRGLVNANYTSVNMNANEIIYYHDLDVFKCAINA